MTTHSEVERRLAEFLIAERGFEQSNLLEDPTYTTSTDIPNVRPDLVAIDPNVREPVAVFEVKTAFPEKVRGKYINQLRSYAEIDPERQLPVYLVSDENGELAFHKYSDEDKSLSRIDASRLPTYQQFVSARIAPRLHGLRRENDRAKDSFRLTASLVAVLLVAVACADLTLSFSGVELLTTNRMALLGGAVALVVIPFAQRFKGLGIEYERLSRDSSGKA